MGGIQEVISNKNSRERAGASLPCLFGLSTSTATYTLRNAEHQLQQRCEDVHHQRARRVEEAGGAPDLLRSLLPVLLLLLAAALLPGLQEQGENGGDRRDCREARRNLHRDISVTAGFVEDLFYRY